jgi:hypothetical protein
LSLDIAVFPSPSRPRRASRLTFSKIFVLFQHRTPSSSSSRGLSPTSSTSSFPPFFPPFFCYDSILEYRHYCPRSYKYKRIPVWPRKSQAIRGPLLSPFACSFPLLFLFLFLYSALRRRSKPVRCRPSTGLASPFSSPSSLSFSRLRHRNTDRRKRAILITSTSSSSHPFKAVVPRFQNSQETLKPSILGNKVPAPHISSPSHAFAFPSGRGFVISFLRTHG